MLLRRGRMTALSPFLFVKDGPMYPKPKGTRRAHWSVFPQHLENCNSSYRGCHLDTSGSFHSARNLHKQQKTIWPKPRAARPWCLDARVASTNTALSFHILSLLKSDHIVFFPATHSLLFLSLLQLFLSVPFLSIFFYIFFRSIRLLLTAQLTNPVAGPRHPPPPPPLP